MIKLSIFLFVFFLINFYNKKKVSGKFEVNYFKIEGRDIFSVNILKLGENCPQIFLLYNILSQKLSIYVQ